MKVAVDMIENSSGNRIAFAAVFVEMFSADAECALRTAGLERERCCASVLRFAAEDFCAAASVPIAERERDSSCCSLSPDAARERALSLAKNTAITCFELAMFVTLETDNPCVRRAADNCATLSQVLLRAVEPQPQRDNARERG